MNSVANMTRVRVGIKTGQGGYSYEELARVWQKSEELGFDSAWLYDHFIALGDPKADCLEAYSTLAALARDRKRIRMGVMATCAGYRNAAYLAKVASTVDVISKGRLMLGLGAGWFEDEYRSYGYDYPADAERVEQMRETIRVVRAVWSEEEVTFKGKYCRVNEAVNFPKPVQKYPPIVVGITKGTKVLPRVAVGEADGFNTTADLPVCKEIVASAEREREKMGRSRNGLIYSVQKFVLTGTEAQIREIVKGEASKQGISAEAYVDSLRKRWLVGTPEYCAGRLREYREAGVDYLFLVVGGDKLGWPVELVKDELLSQL